MTVVFGEVDTYPAKSFDGGYPNIANTIIDNAAYHPAWGAAGIYGLLNVRTPDGRLHLIGTISKQGVIYDFTERKVVYDFTASTGGSIGGVSGAYGLTGPIASGDTYGASCYWESPIDQAAGAPGWYYFGGMIMGPVPIQATYIAANKSSYVLRTQDLVNWQIILKDVKDPAAPAGSWKAEVSQVLGTPIGLFIFRADVGGTGGGLGLYKYDGTSITAVNALAAFEGCMIGDQMRYWVRGSAGMRAVNLITGADASSYTLSTVPCSSGGTRNADPITQGAPGTMNGAQIAGNVSGYFSLTYGGTPQFVPLLGSGSNFATRAIGWRGAALEVDGGLVLAANVFDPNTYSSELQSFLLWIGPGGEHKVLDTGGHFTGLAVHRDRLYYGVTPHHACNQPLNVQIGRPALNSIALQDLKSRVVPIVDVIAMDDATGYVAGTTNVNGVLGGYPTMDYRKGKLRLTTDTAGTLSILTWNRDVPGAVVGTVTFTAGQTQIVDLANYLDGNLLGFTYSASAKLRGSTSFA